MKTFLVLDHTTSTVTVIIDPYKSARPSDVAKFRKRLAACEADLHVIDAADDGDYLSAVVKRIEKRYARGGK
jgi:hypothetical protein